MLVVVDQFEEVFTVCTDEAEQAAFLGALAETANDPEGRVTTVVAIRADLYGRCAEDPTLAALLGTNHVLVGPMSADEYRRAIEQPALRVGVHVESALTEALVAEVGDEPGALPLLSTALLELWERREGRAIKLDAYLETGGVRGAVARLAEEVYGNGKRLAIFERALRLRAGVCFPTGPQPCARPVVLLRVHGQGQHPRATRWAHCFLAGWTVDR